jgi:hypothetical protein
MLRSPLSFEEEEGKCQAELWSERDRCRRSSSKIENISFPAPFRCVSVEMFVSALRNMMKVRSLPPASSPLDIFIPYFLRAALA